MFVCDPCHQEQFGTSIEDRHMFRSLGACENCHHTRPCADCHCGVTKTSAAKSAAIVLDKVVAPVLRIVDRVLASEGMMPEQRERVVSRVRHVIMYGSEQDPDTNETRVMMPEDVDMRALLEAVQGGARSGDAAERG